jgi:protein-tyrosine phosphatase
MIDVHCHLLYRVDDGARTMEESIAMLQEEAAQGVEAIILTPHRRHGMFPYRGDEIEARYMEMLPYAEELGVRLYLGTEYHADSGMIEAFSTGKCHTMADGCYILTEYSMHSEFSFAKQMTQEALHCGYIPVIAHAERYEFIMDNTECAAELRRMGALIQLNADAVLGIEGHGAKKLCRVLLKENLVDVIASDSHGIKERACHMRRCFEYVAKKYGAEQADVLFRKTPEQIVRGS